MIFEWRYLRRRTPWDTGVSPPELLHFLDTHPPGRALDVGCGTGTNALTMATCGWEVVGVDLSLQAVRRARRKARRAGLSIDLRQGDVARLEGVQGPFDFVLDLGCSHALSPQGRQAYLAALAPLVSPGSELLLYTFLATPGDEGRRWPTEAEILTDFGRIFELRSSVFGEDRGRRSAWLSWQRAAS